MNVVNVVAAIVGGVLGSAFCFGIIALYEALLTAKTRRQAIKELERHADDMKFIKSLPRKGTDGLHRFPGGREACYMGGALIWDSVRGCVGFATYTSMQSANG